MDRLALPRRYLHSERPLVFCQKSFRHEDIAWFISLEQYLEKQLAGSLMDAFSLPRHILDRLREIAKRPGHFRVQTRAEHEEHTIMLELIAAR